MLMEEEMKRVRRGARAGDVYCRLMVACAGGKGCRLSADDVHKLMAQDTAMIEAATTWGENEDT